MTEEKKKFKKGDTAYVALDTHVEKIAIAHLTTSGVYTAHGELFVPWTQVFQSEEEALAASIRMAKTECDDGTMKFQFYKDKLAVMERRLAEIRREKMQELEIPVYCPSCNNKDCIELVDEGDEEDSEGVFGNYYVHCTICGRRTNSMDTPEDAVAVWHDNDINFIGTEVVLAAENDFRRICVFSDRCKNKCGECNHVKELRRIDP